MAGTGISTKGTLVFADSDNGGIVHVANIKGGVGKSTVATNLAAALAKRGPTLIIDLDVQGSATHALGKSPSEFSFSSWNLLHCRYSMDDGTGPGASDWLGRARRNVRKAESTLFSLVVGKGSVTSLCVPIAEGMDLVPAGSDLFKNVGQFQVKNLEYNLDLCRNFYKYIVIDTPSVWNPLTRGLFAHCDLNLIPVTLNALSTRSLRDYLINVKRLAQRNPGVRIRIVKNEVFGKQNSKIKGKTRTMSENRRFLERLCEQSVIKTAKGVSVLPQSILFDLEIPESAAVRDAQDEGKSVQDAHQYTTAAKAFEELSRLVQYVLNRPILGRKEPFWLHHQNRILLAAKVLAALLLIAIFTYNRPVAHTPPPRPVAPQQLSNAAQDVISHTFRDGESLYRIAKYAISHFRAVVPSLRDLNKYVEEVITIHNRTRIGDEPEITNPNRVESGTRVTFYPPSSIANPRENELRPVYEYFRGFVSDPYAYITGDWCERGSGGGKPHYGIDVAANLGSEICTPIGGTVVLRQGRREGRTLGVENGGTVVFFSHMARRYYKTGARVERGQAVGTVGMTGKTSGPHVHVGYGIRVPHGGAAFGSHRYKVTDPKLFFYREKYIASMK
ncbi:MAG: AAA family ATPase [Chitinivibrionales bacterium]|nr:AAA family ATPase [Chitinivibrionales bacterium]MBD3396387.1 AAA family ATPase [Chitinivibrionales bacterium]